MEAAPRALPPGIRGAVHEAREPGRQGVRLRFPRGRGLHAGTGDPLAGVDLVNIIWRALAGTHRRLSIGTERTRRYAREFPALFGFADPVSADFESFAAHCEPGDHLYCTEWRGDPPPGWKLEFDGEVVAMLWRGERPVLDPSIPLT